MSTLTAHAGVCQVTVRDAAATTGTVFGFALSVTYPVATSSP